MRGCTIGVFLAALLSAGAALATPCRDGDPAGRYEGKAEARGVASWDLVLNLRCDNGVYAARIFSPIGDFTAEQVSFEAGHVNVAFPRGVVLTDVDLTPSGADLVGGAKAWGVSGTLSLRRAGPALSDAMLAPHLVQPPARWVEDLEFLKRELPRRHANAFAYLPRASFEARIAELERRAPRLGPDAMFVGLLQLINAIGDGHTTLVSPDDKRDMPLELAQVDGAFRVIAVGPGLQRALGARVTAIDGMPIARAHELALTLTPAQELPQLREGRVVYYLARGLTLHGLGITRRRDVAHYTFEDDVGSRFTLAIHGNAPNAEPPMTRLRPKTALAWRNADDPFWCVAIPENRAVYCAWRGYDDLHAKVAAMWSLIDQAHPDKLILDMRDNGGGDNTVGEAELVAPLRARPDLNQRGRLFVLIGPLTFSAAMNNAAQFQDQTAAILVGETIGERPNSYQEPRQFHLPNSQLAVRASTLWYEFRKTGENAVRPTREIIPTWSDLKAGRDPALEWTLAQQAQAPS